MRQRPLTETIVLMSFLGLVSRLAVGNFAPPQLYAPPSLTCYQEWPVDPISINIEDAAPAMGTMAALLNINLTALHGSMRLSLSSSVYVLRGDVFNDSSYSLIGSAQDIRSTLKRVVYAPYIGFLGSDLLTITAAFVVPHTMNGQFYVSPSAQEVTSAIVNVTVNIGSPNSQQTNSSGIIRSNAYNGALTVPSSIDSTEDSSVIWAAGVTLYPFIGDGWNNAMIRQQAMNNWALQINITADHGHISIINAVTGKDACNNASSCSMNGTVSVMTTLLNTISYSSVAGFNKLQGVDVVHLDAVFRSSFGNPLLYGISTSSYVIVEPINHPPTVNLLSNASMSVECFQNNQQQRVSSFAISDVMSVRDPDSVDTLTVSISSLHGKLSFVDDTVNQDIANVDANLLTSDELASTVVLANSTITVSGRMSAIQVALSRIMYALPISCNSSYVDDLTVMVIDFAQASASRSIHIAAVVNAAGQVPSSFALDAPLAVYGIEDEAVSIKGVSVMSSGSGGNGGVNTASNAVLQVTVSATLGTVSFAGSNGALQAMLGNGRARITTGTGTNDSVFEVVGSVDVINQALAAFSFQPVANMNSRWLVLGEVLLSVTEYGSVQSAVPSGDEYNMRNRQIKVYLTPINDPPRLVAPTQLSTSEATFITFADNSLSIHDADEQDAGGCHLTVDVSVSMGYLKMAGSEQMYGSDVRLLLAGTSTYDLEAAKSVQIQGAYPSDINDALSRLVYYPPQDWSGTDTVYVTASDGNNMTVASANISILVTPSSHLLVISAPTVIRLPGNTKMRLENITISDDVGLSLSGSVPRLVTLALTCDRGSVSMGTSDLLYVVQVQESSWSMGGLGKRSRVIVVTAELSYINVLLGTLTYYPPAGALDGYDSLLLMTSSRSIYDNSPYTTSSGIGQSEKTVVIFTTKGTPEVIARLRVHNSALSVKAQIPVAIFTPANVDLVISMSSTVLDSDSTVFVAQCQNCSWSAGGDVSHLGVSMLGASPPSQQLLLAGSVRSLQQALPLMLYTAHVSAAFASDNVTMRLLSSADMDFVMSESQMIVRSTGRTIFPTLLSQALIGTATTLLEIQEDVAMNVSTRLGNESALFTFDPEISDEICRVTVDGNAASMLLKSVTMTGDVVKVR